MDESVKVLVIGAGPAGLPALKHALANSMTPALALEKSEGIGGIWNPKTGYTWDSLSLNTYKYTAKYLNFPYPP